MSDRRQQTAAAARALQAGGRPFEPGTAHPHGEPPEQAPRSDDYCFKRRAPGAEAV